MVVTRKLDLEKAKQSFRNQKRAFVCCSQTGYSSCQSGGHQCTEQLVRKCNQQENELSLNPGNRISDHNLAAYSHHFNPNFSGAALLSLFSLLL
jgi:hypothetical protein